MVISTELRNDILSIFDLFVRASELEINLSTFINILVWDVHTRFTKFTT